MAELALKVGTVGPEPLYQDQDICFACNDLAIENRHLSEICNHIKSGFKNRLRPLGSLAEVYQKKIYSFSFKKVSKKEVIRTNLTTGEQDLLSDIPNKKGEYIHLDEYLKRQLKNKHHRIFEGNVWYGGRKTITKDIVSAVWRDVENKTILRRVDHKQWPFSDLELSHFLVVKTDDFSELQQHDYMSPVEEEFIQDGKTKSRILKMRKYRFDTTTDDLGVPDSSIRDRNKKVDIRKSKKLTRLNRLKVK
ncbi:MAG: hypothetical protein ACE5FY_08140 [Nitrospiria bacterium]